MPIRLIFIRTAHFWTETHPDIDCEPDVIKLMEHNEELARLFLDPTDAEQTRGEVERAQALISLRESEGRFNAVADLVPDLLWRCVRAHHMAQSTLDQLYRSLP
jgi:hypothetical protein